MEDGAEAVRKYDDVVKSVPGALREGAVSRKGSRRPGTTPHYAQLCDVSHSTTRDRPSVDAGFGGS